MAFQSTTMKVDDPRRARLTASLVLRKKNQSNDFRGLNSLQAHNVSQTKQKIDRQPCEHEPNLWVNLCTESETKESSRAQQKVAEARRPQDCGIEDCGIEDRVAKTVRVPHALNRKIRQKCRKIGRSQQSVMLELLENWLAA